MLQWPCCFRRTTCYNCLPSQSALGELHRSSPCPTTLTNPRGSRLGHDFQLGPPEWNCNSCGKIRELEGCTEDFGTYVRLNIYSSNMFQPVSTFQVTKCLWLPTFHTFRTFHTFHTFHACCTAEYVVPVAQRCAEKWP